MSDTPETDAARHDLTEYGPPTPCSYGDWVAAEFACKLERERNVLREENNRLIELLRRDEKPIWMDGARSGAEAGIDMAIKCIESLRESILEKLKEEVK